MANILAVGIATLDIVNSVASYPEENAEIRALSQHQCRGGNATNSLVVLSQLGHQCHWAGVLINEPDSAFIKSDLALHKIDYSACRVLDTGKMPTSYISLDQQTGSRTIIHHRDCPEFNFDDFLNIDFTQFDWVHFEGRNVEQTKLMLEWLKQNHPQLTCSLEVEKPRQNIEHLFPYPNLLLFSKHYVQEKGYDSAESFLTSFDSEQIISCAWGEQGAWAKHHYNLVHSPAVPPEQVIDTIGAGDTFNAALIDALLAQQPIQQALDNACLLAGKKCGQIGFNHLIT